MQMRWPKIPLTPPARPKPLRRGEGPALSRGERERLRKSLEMAERTALAASLPAVLPLPVGEGRGEGNSIPDGCSAPKPNEPTSKPGAVRARGSGCLIFGPLGVALVLAAFLLFPFLNTVPGLHGDEAWAGVRAHEIMEGRRPLIGMNWYTGPIHQYLLVPLLRAFGYKVVVLRLLTVANSLIFVVLYFIIARHLFDEVTAGLAVLTLVSLPAFTAYGRPAYEVFALNPVLAAGASVLLLEAGSRSPYAQKLLWACAGICLGLGTWNHLIFAAVPVSLLAAALAANGFSIIRQPALYLAAYGFFIGLAPRLLFVSAPSSNGMEATLHQAGSHFLPQLLQRLREWPGLFAQMVHGYPIYRRFAGEVRLHVPDLVAPILVAGLAAHLKRRGAHWGRSGWQIAIFGVVLFLATLALCPRNSDRYFLLVLYVVPLPLACAFREILELPSLRRLATVAFCAFLGLQLTETACNYFVSQVHSHGRLSEYHFGSHLETSSNYTRTDGLYERLVSLGAKHVFAEFFITMPLRFYDLEHGNFASASIVDSARAVPPASQCRPGTYAVVYAGGLRRVQADQYQGFEELFRDEHFVILKPSVAAAR